MTADFDLDLTRVARAIDPDYDAIRVRFRRQTYWHTGRRVWVTAAVGEMVTGGRGGVTPVDPDAALEQARIDGHWPGPGALAPDNPRARAVLDWLREHGPATAAQVWRATHMDYRTFDRVAKVLLDLALVQFVWVKHPRTGVQVRMWGVVDEGVCDGSA